MNETSTRPHLVILGLMGVGKSTTAAAVAAARRVACHDSDADIETVFGATGAELAAELGVDELHRIESAMLLGRLADDAPSVISAAASIVDDERCRDALARRAVVVVLRAEVDEILRRAATGAHRRAIDRDELAALAVRRASLFEEVSDLDLDASATTAQLVSLILDQVETPRV